MLIKGDPWLAERYRGYLRLKRERKAGKQGVYQRLTRKREGVGLLEESSNASGGVKRKMTVNSNNQL